MVVHALTSLGATVVEGATIGELETRGDAITAVVLEDGQRVACALLVSHADAGIQAGLLTALNDQSLVVDGRLVVDAGFRTNDPAIRGGGDLVKLARRIQDARRFVCVCGGVTRVF